MIEVVKVERLIHTKKVEGIEGSEVSEKRVKDEGVREEWMLMMIWKRSWGSLGKGSL